MVATVLFCALTAAAWGQKDDTLLVSRASGPAGLGGDRASSGASISADGRSVAFTSSADNLSGEDGRVEDVFVRDLEADTTTLVSRASGPAGAGGDGPSGDASISADGRFVAFSSSATNLSAEDGGSVDVFVRDLQEGTTTLVSRASGSAAAAADADSFNPSISADGRFVAFTSLATNLSEEGDDETYDVFVRDLQAATTTLVSRAAGAAGAAGDGNSDVPSISADGRRVAFESIATNLSDDDVDLGASTDVFVRDLDAATTTLVSRASGSAGAAGDQSSNRPSISPDGRFVGFESAADNLSEDDVVEVVDIFLRDLQESTTTFVSRASGESGPGGDGDSVVAAVSAGGLYVAFQSSATNLSAEDREVDDVFVHDIRAATTTLVSRGSGAAGAGGDAPSSLPSISADGRLVAFESDATNLSGDDNDVVRDVFVRDVLGAPPPPRDVTPPETTITAGPSGQTNEPTPIFGFASNEGESTFECRVDAGAFAPCSSPHTTGALADGARTFEVRAIDAAGNVDPTPATRSFTVDTTPPNTTISSGPPGTTSDSTPQFTFVSPDDPSATYECRIYQGAPSGAFTACTSPHTTATLPDGSYTFEVRARDAVANVDPTPAQRAFALDTGAPAAPTFAGTTPGSPANDNTPEIRGSAEAGSTVSLYTTPSCIGPPLVTGTAAAFASPGLTVSVADNSATTLYASATDASGNASGCSLASITYVEDSSAPDTTIGSGPTATTTDDTPEFGFSSEPGARFECRVYQGASPSGLFTTCSSPHTTQALAAGAHTFEVRAVDAAGNADPTPAARSFTVATPVNQPEPPTPPPDTAIDSAPPELTKERTPSFTFKSSTPGTTFECSLDGSPFAPCRSPFVTPRLRAGRHIFQVRARDSGGNVDPTPATVVFSVTATLADLPPPTVGRTFNVEPVGPGQVFISESPRSARARASARVPGIKGRNFVPLREARHIPVGSLLDTRKGTVRLVSARDARGRTQTGDFLFGVFQVLQSRARSARGITELRLKGASFARCGRRGGRGKKASSARSRRRIRRLRGNARGRFRTRGRYSAATVRGTVWEVSDRCDGTLTRVNRGGVAVRDFRRRKNILVRPGESYLARARR